MAYVIYNKKTTETLLAPAASVGCYIRSYKTESAAKAALTRLDKKGKLGVTVTMVPVTLPNNLKSRKRVETPYVKADFAIADAVEFRDNIEKTVTRTNAMTGKPFEERMNADYATSPSSENYWCS